MQEILSRRSGLSFYLEKSLNLKLPFAYRWSKLDKFLRCWPFMGTTILESKSSEGTVEKWKTLYPIWRRPRNVNAEKIIDFRYLAFHYSVGVMSCSWRTPWDKLALLSWASIKFCSCSRHASFPDLSAFRGWFRQSSCTD